MSILKFGWSEIDITPKEKIALNGEFFERITNDVETPISVTALAIESGNEQVVFCSCDLVEVSEDLVFETRIKINAPGLDPQKVILSAVHTHNSYTIGNHKNTKIVPTLQIIKQYIPEGCEYVDAQNDINCMLPETALDIVSDKIAEAVSLAWQNRSEGGYANGFGRAAVGMNRRVCYADGTAKMWGDVDDATFTELEGGNDSGIELLFIYDKNRKLSGIVANVACPAQVMEQRTIISGDYWGKVKILLRRKYGNDIYLLALCSAAGDLCPRDMIRWVEPETPIQDPNIIRNQPKKRMADPSMFDIKGTWTIGYRIFNEIEYALVNISEIRTEAEMIHHTKILLLPLRRVTQTERNTAEQHISEFFKKKKVVNYIDSAGVHVYAGTIQRYEIQQNKDMVETEVHYIRVNDIAFATNPFELFLNYGNQIRARSAAKQTFLVQLACGSLGYLPTEKAEKSGHYSAYIASGTVGHEGGDLLVRDTLYELNEMFTDNSVSSVKL